MTFREIIIGGLLLPFQLYFQPNRFCEKVSDLAPDLPRFYSLWQARNKFHDPVFRRRASAILFQYCLAMGWGSVFAYLLAIFGIKINWLFITVTIPVFISVGIMVGFAISVIAGIAFSLAFGVTATFALAVVGGSEKDIITGVAWAIGAGVILQFTDTTFRRNPFISLIIPRLSSAITGVIILSFYYGILYGDFFNIPLLYTYYLTSLLFITHLLIYPIQFFLSWLSRMISQVAPQPLLYSLWQLSPIRWDETIILPLPGLSQFLVSLQRYDADKGMKAIVEVSNHLYQFKAAFVALGKLAFEDARQLETLSAIASYERGMDWLDSETVLPDRQKKPLLLLKEISQMIDAAEQSDTHRNRINQLRIARERAGSIRHNLDQFGPVLSKWQKIITNGLEKAEEERRILEPIHQVYFNDGAPISPDELPEDESPFKGRTNTVRELESALGDLKRSTLLLTGNRRSGKSSLLLQLPRKLGPQVLPAFIDCQSAGIASSESAGGMLIGLAEAIMEQAHRNVDKFRRDPVKFPRIDQEAFERDPYPAFSRWLDETERALGGRKLLLCLDEFEKLEDALAGGRVDGRFLSLLRNIIQHHSRIIVLLSGSHHLDELPPRWADALVSTQSLKISFLDETDARELIVRPVKGFPDIYQPDAVELILRLTHSQPYLIQLLCGLLVEKMNRERREPPASYVAVADVESVIPLALDRGEAYFNDLWRSQTGGNLARLVLEKLAFADGESATSAEIRELTDDEEGLRTTIRTLLRREIIEQTPDSYHITVPLVGYYVRSQCRPV